jgi:tellurite resistance protein TerC
MNVPWSVWLGTVAVLAVLIRADLMLTRSTRGSSLRSAAAASALWIAAGCAFGAVLWLWHGSAIAGQYFASYLLEKSLSVDNIFVFVLLFASLGVPAALQRHVLYLGVLGALVLRGVFIAAGGVLIDHVSWVFYVFGGLVLAMGIRMFRSGALVDPSKNPVLRALRQVVPVTSEYRGTRLFTRVNGRTAVTPLLVALVAIETTDLVFALDSIPAVFGITRDVFLVFTSNAFAVLGLRALYFLLARSMDRFSYLRPGLAILLVFIGVKMLISPLIEVPVMVSLAVIITVIGWAAGASLWRRRAGKGERSRAVPR